VIYAGCGHPHVGWREHESPPHVFLKDTSKKDLLTRAGRLGGLRYNRFSLQVESVYSNYIRVFILGNDTKIEQGERSARSPVVPTVDDVTVR
jgi:hypothetical protein